MKIFLICGLLVAFGTAAQNTMRKVGPDSASAPTVRGRLLLGNAGFAPVPAFSFDRPIAISFLSIKKNRFSYEPDFALGLNGKPWMANNWFRFAAVERKRLKLRAGLNPSLFFKTEKVDSIDIVHAHRNFTFETAASFQISERISIAFMHMKIHAFDRGTLSGNFFDVSSSIDAVRVPEVITINLKPQLFYFAFESNVSGLFTSATVSAALQKIPLSFYYQAVCPLVASFDTHAFKWNAGLIYRF